MLRFILVVACLFLLSCQKKSELTLTENKRSGVTLRFFGGNDTDSLVHGGSYTNPFNESLLIEGFRFYIHNIQLIPEVGEPTAVIAEHYLVDVFDPLTASINLQAPAGTYTGLRFVIGVDSVRNFSGAQTGALDPAKGMFWTWNSGYIMAKLEGQSPQASTPGNHFEYHIGGYKPGESVIRTAELAAPGRPFQLQEGGNSQILIRANPDSWFDGPFQLRIAENPVVATPGPLAVAVANNYQSMFRVISVTSSP